MVILRTIIFFTSDFRFFKTLNGSKLHPPVNIHFFKVSIPSFHFFGAIGYFVGLIVGICIAHFTKLALWPLLLCGIIGAAVLFGLTYIYKKITGKEDLVYYQHEIIILICCTIVLLLLNLPVLKYLDITLIGIGVFLAFGRIGCFSVGCCHGKPGKTGVIYTDDHVAEGFNRHFVGIPIFPIQLVESICVFVTVVIGSYFILNNFLPGSTLLIYTIIYGAVRFILEYFRGDTERPYWMGFSEAQWTTLGIFVVSVILSLFNLLPHYIWHLSALHVLVLFMIIITIVRKIRNTITFKLFQPKHILEIAKGIETLERNSFQANKILIFKTSEELNISMGKTTTAENILIHYTLSINHSYKKNKKLMNKSLANKLGKLIKILRYFDNPFEISNEQTGIFHILFSLPVEKTGVEKIIGAAKLQPFL